MIANLTYDKCIRCLATITEYLDDQENPLHSCCNCCKGTEFCNPNGE